jgi:hypothetical protein
VKLKTYGYGPSCNEDEVINYLTAYGPMGEPIETLSIMHYETITCWYGGHRGWPISGGHSGQPRPIPRSEPLPATPPSHLQCDMSVLVRVCDPCAHVCVRSAAVVAANSPYFNFYSSGVLTADGLSDWSPAACAKAFDHSVTLVG